ncbi:ATP-binding protein [Gordonia rhizosphera]|uniref:ATP-binding protein n=1 Tax=Gordonia rhizosphera TaxID=83341 RepID=UPI000590C0BF|nr:ATP-binding protein [Gordonia rhizosphera]
MISGPAGVGKTRLTDVVDDIAGNLGLPVASGRAVDDAIPRGLVVILEDLHWADRTSLLLLRHLVADLSGARLLVVVTVRDPAGPAEQEQASELLTELLRAPGAIPLPLTGLSSVEVRRWLDEVLGPGTVTDELADRVHRGADGNPLLVRLIIEAILAHDGSSIPELSSGIRVRQMTRGLLARVEPPTREMLSAAAVLGEHIDPTVVGRMLDRPDVEIAGAIEEATLAGILRSMPGSLAFTHALVRDAVYTDIGEVERRTLHAAAARVLGERADSDDVAGIIATHWRNAGDAASAERCVTWAQRAADAAWTSYAHDEAAHFRSIALEAMPDDREGRRRDLLIAAARAEFAAGQIATSLDRCCCAADLGESVGDGGTVAEAALIVSGIGSAPVMGVVDELCGRALDMLPDGDPALHARLLAQRALAAAEREDVAALRMLSETALGLAERSADPDALLDAVHARHLALTASGHEREREQLARRAIAIADRAGQPLATMWGHVWMADAGFGTGDLALIETALTELERVAARRHLRLARWHALRLRAALALLRGDIAQAIAHNDGAAMLGDRGGNRRGTCRVRGIPTHPRPRWRRSPLGPTYDSDRLCRSHSR